MHFWASHQSRWRNLKSVGSFGFVTHKSSFTKWMSLNLRLFSTSTNPFLHRQEKVRHRSLFAVHSKILMQDTDCHNSTYLLSIQSILIKQPSLLNKSRARWLTLKFLTAFFVVTMGAVCLVLNNTTREKTWFLVLPSSIE